MRILQLAKYYPPAPGGIETFVRDLSHALTAQGHDNLVLAHRFEKTEPESLEGPMGRVLRVPSLGELMYAPMAPGYPFRLHALLRDFKPDMLLVHMPNLSGFWPLLMPVKCPMVVYWHSDVVFPPEKRLHNLAYAGYSFFEQKLLKRAHKVIATSEPYLAFSRPLRLFKHKCTVIPLGIDPLRIPDIAARDELAVRARLLGDANVRYVYSAGRFAHYKGFDRLVRGAARTREEHPELKYVIAGDGETRSAVLRLIRDLGLESHVFCPGRVDDREYWALMRGCELFCLPSIERTEAFGIVLLEAMAMGKPCISTSIPGSGTGWVNRDGETGVVVKPDDVEGLAAAIMKLHQAGADAPRSGPKYFRISDTAQALAALHEMGCKVPVK
jgi:rhamnosyl/mannosyltransferase